MDIKDKHSRSDEDIVALVQSGKREYMGEIMNRYEQKLLFYVQKIGLSRADAEDVVQEVFIKSYKNIQSFRTNKKYSSWIYAITHNECVNRFRKIGREAVPFFDADSLWPHPVSGERTDQRVDQKQMKQILDKGLQSVSYKYREPLVLYYLEERSYKEIADILKMPVSTIGVRIKRGKMALRKAFKKLGITYDITQI